MLSGMTSMAGPAASGGGALLTLDTPPADQALASGSTSSSGITFAAPTGGSGSYSYAAVLDTVAATGTPALSGSGLGPYTVTGLSDGDLCVVRMTYTDTVTGQTAEQGVAVGVAQAGGGGAGLSSLLDIDLTALGSYDFLTTGGTGGSGGDGPHSVGGYSFVLAGSSGLATLSLSASGLTVDQGTGGAFELGIDLRALATALEPAGPVHVLARAASAVSDAAGDGLQVGIHRSASLGTWTKGDSVVRYRQADGTPDFYGITYNGSSWDAVAGPTVTASGDVRMQVSMTALQGSVLRGDTGTASDPADWKTLPEIMDGDYASTLATHSAYPGDSNVWAWMGGGGDCRGVFKSFTAYGLEA